MPQAPPPEPRAIARYRSFFAGGREVTVSGRAVETITFNEDIQDFRFDPNGTYRIEQAYVQEFVPVGPVREVAVLLLHGGGMTGASFEATPDGRPGWLQDFLSAGFRVAIVDEVERGRAGFSAAPGVWTERPLQRTAEVVWADFRIGPPQGFAERHTFAGSAFPVGAFDAFMAAQVPRWLGNVDAQCAALADAVARLGPLVILAHSQGARHAARIAAAGVGDIRGLVLVEPAGFVAPEESGAVWQLHLYGDFIDRSDLWRSLRARSTACCAALAAAGIDAEAVDLPERGIGGGTHATMADLTSTAVAAFAIDAIDRHLGTTRDGLARPTTK